jgi:hypothetical protein
MNRLLMIVTIADVVIDGIMASEPFQIIRQRAARETSAALTPRAIESAK